MIVIQLLCNGFQTFMDMVLISVGYGPDIEGGGDSLLKLFLLHLKRYNFNPALLMMIPHNIIGYTFCEIYFISCTNDRLPT